MKKWIMTMVILPLLMGCATSTNTDLLVVDKGSSRSVTLNEEVSRAGLFIDESYMPDICCADWKGQVCQREIIPGCSQASESFGAFSTKNSTQSP